MFVCVWVHVTEKAMAPHSNTLAWKIPWTEEPGRLQSMGSRRVGWTWLSDFTFTFHFQALGKEMATHSSVLAWRIPGMGEPGGLPSVGLHSVRHDWSDLAAAASTYEHSLLCDLFLVKDNITLHVSSVFLDQICPDKGDDAWDIHVTIIMNIMH